MACYFSRNWKKHHHHDKEEKDLHSSFCDAYGGSVASQPEKPWGPRGGRETPSSSRVMPLPRTPRLAPGPFTLDG